jgi:opacity protein-like surface antigen
MKNSDFPYGKYQPYVGIGPSAVISSLEIDEFDDTSIDLGLDAKVGFSMFFVHNFAVFVEYRYTSVESDYDDRMSGAKVEIESDIETHHALIGLSYHF